MTTSNSSEEISSAAEELPIGDSRKQKVSSAEAVLLGALAPGVNAPTWSAVKFTFFTLAVCLAAMLALAFSSSDATMIIHIILLVFISGVLFFLLTRFPLVAPSNIEETLQKGFLAETGLVSVEQQMQDMGLSPKDQSTESTKKSS